MNIILFTSFIFQEKENIGSLSDRQGLRKNLGCQSFAWYLENIFPEKKVPMCIIYAGEVRRKVILI